MTRITTFVSVGLMVGALLSWGPKAHANPATGRAGRCEDVLVQVSAHQGEAPDDHIAATLCTPHTWAPGEHRTDILVAGATYNQSYWDWPENPGRYSYVSRTLRAGRATFSFDRLGTGRSDKPAGLSQNVDDDAYTLHQLIDWVRAREQTRVDLIGHSLGSIILTKEQARWHDADRLVVTGILHLPGIGLNSTGFATSLYPAAADPRFALTPNSQPGYLTTLPGRRGPTFYDPRTADPDVIAYDEAHKDVATIDEVRQSIVELETPAALNSTRNITAPVLIVMGQTDNIFCNLAVDCSRADSIVANEKPYYSAAPRLDVATVPDTAHNLALHPSAPISFEMINSWLTTDA